MAYIHFADERVKTNLMLYGGIGDGSGITYEQAAAYTGDLTYISNGKTKGIFEDCYTIATLSDLVHFTGIRTIGNGAFAVTNNDTKLKNFTFPPNITAIGKSAFIRRSGHTGALNIPSGVTSIGEAAFSGSKATSITINGNVTTIPAHAFEGCLASSITLPVNLKVLGEHCFQNCNETRFVLPDTVSRIGAGALNQASRLSYIKLPKNNTVFVGDPFVATGGIKSPENIVFHNYTYTFRSSLEDYASFRGTNILYLSKNIPSNNSCIRYQKCYVRGQATADAWNATKYYTDPDAEPIKFGITPSSQTFSAETSIHVTMSLNVPQSLVDLAEDENHGYSFSNVKYQYSDSLVTSGYTNYTHAIDVNLTYENTPITINSKLTLLGDEEIDTAVYDIKLPTPVLSISGGTYLDNVTVSATCANPDASLYYTIDGSTPTTASTMAENGRIFIDTIGNITLKVRAIVGNAYSDVATGSYLIRLSPPVITPSGGTFSEVASGITITCPNSGATIYYTLDGSVPTSASTQYTGAFNIDVVGSTTVKAVAYKYDGYSTVVTGEFVVTPPVPIISPESGYYENSVEVTMSTNVSGSTFYYTLDGTDPTSASTQYQGAILIDNIGQTTLKAVAYKDGYNSSVVTKDYYIIPSAPIVTPSSGDYAGAIRVTMSTATSGATIYYTLDGTDPTSASTQYHGEVMLYDIGQTTLKAVAYKDGYNSNVVTNVYNITSDAPNISPSAGTFNDRVDVTISNSNDKPIYYTLDGSTPTSASTLYENPVLLYTAGEYTIKAVWVDGDYTSFIATASLTVVDTQTGQPTILPDTETSVDSIEVTFETAESGDTVYYTLDGTEPTSASTVYNGTPIELLLPYGLSSTTYTVKAKSHNTNHNISWSDTVTKTYELSEHPKSNKPRRASDNNNGIYVKNVTYSGLPVNFRSSYILPSAITVNDTEADVTWSYHADGVEEDFGEYGTKCHVDDTSITVHVEFTHGGKKYTLEKVIPCTCIVQDEEVSEYTLDLLEANAICTLENHLDVHLLGRVKHTTEGSVSNLTDITNFELSGTSSNGNFFCNKEGAYFTYDDTLTLDYSGSTHPANDITLTLINIRQGAIQNHVIPVTFEAGSIFEVRDDAIRMAVASSVTYTDGEISGVTNHISQLEINISGITGTVSALTNTVSGISADVSQLQQTASSITSTVTNLSGEMVTHSELAQTASSITAQVVDEVGEITGMFISAGTITLDASKTIITGQLSVDDGIAFYDDNGNLAVTVDGEDIGEYKDQTNGSIAYKYVYHSEADTIGYQFTTNKEPIGQYESGDTISFNYLSEWCTVTPNGGGTGTWDTASANTLQVQLYVGDASEPFSSTTVTLTGDTNSPMRARNGSPICEFIIPSDDTVYVKYAFASSASSQVGTRSAHVSAQIGLSDANSVKIGKGGVSMAHAANYLTYLGADDTVLRKGTTGIKYGTWGTDQYNMRTGLQIAASTYHLTSGEFSEHPDNLSADTRICWTPMYNYTPHTQATYCCDTYYGEVTGYEGFGEKYNARIREDKLYGDLWLDMLQYGGQDLRGENIMLLLPPTTRQVVVDNKTAIHSLPEGYTVRVHNMGFYNGVYIVPNLIDGYSVYPASFYLPNGTREGSLSFNHNDAFIELVYAGTYSLSDLGMRQLWYVRNYNQ